MKFFFKVVLRDSLRILCRFFVDSLKILCRFFEDSLNVLCGFFEDSLKILDPSAGGQLRAIGGDSGRGGAGVGPGRGLKTPPSLDEDLPDEYFTNQSKEIQLSSETTPKRKQQINK